MSDRKTSDHHKDFIQQLAKENREFYGLPKGRGILKAPELSFDHRWIYLFELVQNALDAGARAISIQERKENASLVFQHNGDKKLCEEDVKKLSEMFGSAKSASSIGFMGIGFKSLFLRFQEVRVSGWDWFFRYEIGHEIGEQFGDAQFDFLGAVSPIWDPTIGQPDRNFTTRFELRKTIPSSFELQHDLDRFLSDEDDSLLALLAEAGLRTLILNERAWNLSVGAASSGTFRATAEAGGKSEAWQLFAVEYQPSNEAIRRFLEHRKIKPLEEEKEKTYAEVSRPRRVLGVLPLDADGKPKTSGRGRVYATLPTDVLLPFGLHINADWLLDISRTGLREIEDNQWQRELVDHIADVLARFLVWSAETYSDPKEAKASFDTLAAPEQEAGGLEALLSEKRWLARLRKLLVNSAVLPAWTEKRVPLGYAAPIDTVAPPDPLAKIFKEMPDILPAILLNRNVVNLEILSTGAQELMEKANLLVEIGPSELGRAWPKGLRRWWKIQSGAKERRQVMLLRIWAAMAELSEDAEWYDFRPRCVLTMAGNWITAEQATIFKENLPSGRGIDEKETRELLLPYVKGTGRVPGKLLRMLRKLARDEDFSDLKYSKAKTWIESRAKSLSLRDIVETVFADTALSDRPDWSVLIPFGRWAKKQKRSDLLTYVLVDSTEQLIGLPVSDSVLADPFISNGKGLRYIYSEKAPISKAYLNSDSSSEDVKEWRDFFFRAGVNGRLDFDCPPKTAERWQKGFVAEFIGLDKGSIGESNDHGYRLFDYDIVPQLPDSDSPLQVREAIAPWLDEGRSTLDGKGRREAKYRYHSQKACVGVKPCMWVGKLKKVKWVPCSDGELRQPQDVLPSKDQARSHCPYTSLSRELVEVLEQEGIQFGSAVPEAEAIHKLKMTWKNANVEELAQMLRECQSKIKSDLDQNQFKGVLELITFPLPSGQRVPLSRLVASDHRNLLGGWIVKLSEFDESLCEALKQVIYPIPNQTTGRQSLEFIRHVWSKAKSSPNKLGNEEIEGLPFAYDYCLHECENDAELRRLWRAAVPEAVVSVDGEWVFLADSNRIFIDDVDERRYVPEKFRPRAAIAKHLGRSKQSQNHTSDELGLKSLKESLNFSWHVGGPLQVTKDTRDWHCRINLVWQLLRHVDDSEGHLEIGTHEAQCPIQLTLVIVQELELSVEFDGAEPENVPVDARLQDNELLVVNSPMLFASDAAKELMHRFSFSQRGDLASALTGLLSAIDDAAAFRRAVDKFRRSHARDFEILKVHEQCWVGEVKPDPSLADVARDRTRKSAGVQAQNLGPRDKPTAESDRSGGHSASHGGKLSTGSGSFSRSRAALTQRPQMKGEIHPSSVARHNDGRASGSLNAGLGDELFREIAARYEKKRGWIAVFGTANQPGWDIRSSDPKSSQVRYIEVKGKGKAWEDEEVVELSRAQVRKAFEMSKEKEADWYLYVVECEADGYYRVLPIRNPLVLADSWMLCGGIWRQLAENPMRIDLS